MDGDGLGWVARREVSLNLATAVGRYGCSRRGEDAGDKYASVWDWRKNINTPPSESHATGSLAASDSPYTWKERQVMQVKSREGL